MQQKQKAAGIFKNFRKKHSTGIFSRYIVVSKKDYQAQLMAPILRIIAEMEKQLEGKN